MIYFELRKYAREFAKKQPHYKVVDCKENRNMHGLRWAVRVLR